MAELLHKLRECLTIPEAAAHLSTAFGESVTEADVLRLGLDDHLTLSINYVNPVWGWLGRASTDAGQRTREAVAARTADQGIVPLRRQNRRGQPVSVLGVSRTVPSHRCCRSR
jgi:hypothetical protein